jgi:hypothetical protein
MITKTKADILKTRKVSPSAKTFNKKVGCYVKKHTFAKN